MRTGQRLIRHRVSAAFLAQIIAQARPGLSPAREARRRPAPALEAYRTATTLKARDPVGDRLDLSGI